MTGTRRKVQRSPKQRPSVIPLTLQPLRLSPTAEIIQLPETLGQAFPAVDPGIVPFGQRVLVQIRRPRTKSAGGILHTDDTRETIKWNTQVAKVIALGPLAFRSRKTDDNALREWPEGPWCAPGDFVRVPKYGGDKWEVLVPGAAAGYENAALFVIFNDLDLIGKVTGDPLIIKAYV